MGGKLGKLAVGGIATVGAAIGALSAKIAVDGVKAIIGYEEQVSKLQAVFGAQGDAMLKWAEKSSLALRLPQADLVAATGGFGNLFDQLKFNATASGEMSKKVITLAADLGSFNNVPTADVIAAQTSAFRGEYDSLQALIPTINAATVEQIALEMSGKKTTKELTAQEKAAAVLEAMMRGAGKAVGDAGRTSESTAGQIATLNTGFNNAKLEVGNLIKNEFLPEFLKQMGIGGDKSKTTAERVQNVIEALKKAGPQVREIAGNVADFAKDVKSLVDVLIKAVTWIDKAGNSMGKLGGSNLGQNKQKGLQWSDLPGFAAGGSVNATGPIIVGEKGPEIFWPATSGQIIPNGGGGSSKGSGNLHLTLVMDGRTVAELVRENLLDFGDRNVLVGLG